MEMELEIVAEGGLNELFRTEEHEDVATDSLVDYVEDVNVHSFLLVAAVLFWMYVKNTPFYQVLLCVSLATAALYLCVCYIAFLFLNGNIKWIRRELGLFRAVLEDATGVTSLSNQLKAKLQHLASRYSELDPSRAIAGLEFVRLKKSEVAWLQRNDSAVREAEDLVEAFEKRGIEELLLSQTIWSLSFSSLRRRLMEIEDFFQWTGPVKYVINGRIAKKKALKINICRSVEKSWSVIRNLLDRPIEQHENKWVESILEVDTGELKSSLLKRARATITTLRPIKIFGITEARNVELRLILLCPFMELIKDFPLESKIERAWLKEVYELVAEANELVAKANVVLLNRCLEATEYQNRWLRVPDVLWDWKARRKLKADMSYVDVGFADLFEVKERYGFQFIVRDSPNQSYQHADSEDQISSLVNNIRYYLEGRGLVELDWVYEKLELLCDQLDDMYKHLKDPSSNVGINNLREAPLKEIENIAGSASKSTKSFSKKFEGASEINDQLWSITRAGRQFSQKIAQMWSTKRARRQLSQDIDQIKHHIDLLERSLTAYKIELRDESSSVVGLEDDVEAVISKLTADEANTGHQDCSSIGIGIVSIIGMEGVGKTTLAKKIYSLRARIGHFDTCMWINVPGNFDYKLSFLEDVAKQILVYLHRDGIILHEHWSNSDKHLWEIVAEILEMNKYFLVLDNVSKEAWGTLEIMLRAKSDGSKIVLTTRSVDFASVDEQQRSCGQSSRDGQRRYALHRLRLRTKAESLSLLKQMVNVSRDEEDRIAQDIVSRCWGLPLSIVRGGYMTLQQGGTAEIASKVLDAVKKLESSFKKTNHRDLPPHLNQFLQHFELLPRDFEISARRLITLWVSEGLVERSREENETLEQVAEERLSELIGRGVFQTVRRKASGKVKTCRLPFKTEPQCHEFKLDSQEQQFEDVSRSVLRLAHHFGKNGLSLCLIRSESSTHDERLADDRELHHYDPKVNEDPIEDIGCFLQRFIEKAENIEASYRISLDFTKLQSFLIFDPREGNEPGETIGNFLRKGIERDAFQNLRVLDLERAFRPELPNCIGKLKKLKYLGLRWTHLKSIPWTIGDLVDLETLDVKHTYLCALPSSVRKLKNLRNLYLNRSNRCKFLRQPSDSFLKFRRQPSYSFLENLQTLWGMCVYEDSPIEDCLDKLTNIRKLGMEFQLDVSEQTRILSERISKLTQLQTLRLRSTAKTNEAQKLLLRLSDLKNLSSIELFGMPLDPALVHQLPKKLTELTLSASGLLEDPMLELGKLSNLKILCFYSDSYKGKQMCCPEESFPQLRVLKLWKLKELEELKVRKKALQNLRELETRTCLKMKVLKGLENLEMLLELKVTNMPYEFAMEIENEKSLIWGNSSHSPSINIQKGESS
ncbi:NB-ARC domain, LRR domain containing protein [Trema orientale]|uniref:NB-ARC domain, LRR domain containing protein n=1 Tax=Trema orientale TaxID=63057 RepID=A0A2P5ETR7_TREOI|nr:NB-ARC domain, LRR domain containing protein [Trema orientale]